MFTADLNSKYIGRKESLRLTVILMCKYKERVLGALVNGIKASVFGGIPSALVGGLILDKFLSVKQFRLKNNSRTLEEIREIREYYGVAVECESPTWLGRNMYEYLHYKSKFVSCRWELSEEWVLATLVLGITSAFWVYRYLSKNS